MFDNSNFNAALEQTGLTMYALSKISGVPYTTVNEIHNGRISINQCAAETVWRLAASLGTEPDSLINHINYLDGVKGKYKGIDYEWSTDDGSCITFEYDGKPVTLNAGAYYNIPSRIRYYNIAAGWMIKEYIEHRQWEKEIEALLERKDNER